MKPKPETQAQRADRYARQAVDQFEAAAQRIGRYVDKPDRRAVSARYQFARAVLLELLGAT